METTLFHGLFSSKKNNKKMEVETVQNPENKKSASKVSGFCEKWWCLSNFGRSLSENLLASSDSRKSGK